ncbi:MAG TPA: prephenate dehydrogenase [Streptosporangiaceae bacterium]
MTALQEGQDGAPAGIATTVVIGTGLIGTSIALALREQGVSVWLTDQDPAAAQLAADMGAGMVLPERYAPARYAALPQQPSPDLSSPERRAPEQSSPQPRAPERRAPEPTHPLADLAVVAVPPAAVASSLAAAQAANLARSYTDVASVKSLPLRQAWELGCDLTSFVPGHPLSGRERSGPAAARADLFLGRPWVICPTPEISPDAVADVTALIRICRAEPLRLDAEEHDRYVALVSHAPHVAAAAMAARLADAPAEALALAGQGLRDVTRIAAGDVGLWTQILTANAAPVARVLADVAADLSAVAEALADAASARSAAEQAAVVKALTGLLDEGVAGVAKIPGKRGKPPTDNVVVQVVIPDRPGEFARLFQVAGGAGVNIEDFAIEHSPGLPVGVAELTVRPAAVAPLTQALAAAGWPVRG